MAGKGIRDLDKTKSHENRAAKPPSKLATRLMIVAFVVTMVSVQIVIAAIFIPAARSEDKHADASSSLATDSSFDDLEPMDESTPAVEVDLGSFEVTSYQPSSEATLRIDFQLWGIVTEDHLSEFTRVFQHRKNRLREQVQIVVRSSDPNDLRDSGLGLVKRRLLSRVNRSLGKRLLQDIVVPHFSIVEI